MSSLSQILHTISYMGLPLLFAMVLHEFAHGWVAEKCGDSTAKLQGRLTVNPLAHIDPFGTVILPLICLLLPGSFLFGWAKPVPIDPRNMHQPRRDMALVAAAGPGMNLILAVASALLLAVLLTIEPTLSLRGSTEAEASTSLLGTMFLRPIAVMALYSVMINVLLALFNLLPIPPLDGGRILTAILPPKPAMALARLEPYGMLILVGLIVFDKELGVIHTITGTFANGLSGTILSTALGLRPGVSE
ncbi:MAG: Membrane endopeptidase, M50 family [Candidatus Nitrospira kreftii]|jgi:Zn-dependent protease|uniref:Membrane endopeptidase, M50 family n=1 Tax=Candidatus Nitrospira kreftii TaxID=2652173 RepID=A0A7S8FG40_9BACT|nr:MAG: Membrane endopeptidase, M50 family [Candidatus Nitrospira kreftii]